MRRLVKFPTYQLRAFLKRFLEKLLLFQSRENLGSGAIRILDRLIGQLALLSLSLLLSIVFKLLVSRSWPALLVRKRRK